MAFLGHDLRMAFRSLGRNPGITAVAALTLSLGVGATTSIFSLLNGVILQSLPYPEPERIVVIHPMLEGVEEHGWSGANFVDVAARATSYEAIAGYRAIHYAVRGEPYPEMDRGASVTPAFFHVFGTPPLLGRVFNPEADRPGGERVVVLAHQLWSSRFAADPAVVGRAVEISGESYTVVGVMPPGFEEPGRTQLWVASRYRPPEPPIPMETDPAENRGANYFSVVARLKDGVSIAQAGAEGEVIAARIVEQNPDFKGIEGFKPVPLQDSLVGTVRPTLLMLFGAVALVLLIACANVANLLLARATGRVHEFALRTALGAGRGRLARQLLTESALLGLVGGGGGVLLAFAGTRVALDLAAADLPRAAEVSVSLPVLGFALAVSLLSGLLFGVTPLLWITRHDPAKVLREAGGRSVAGGAHARTRAAVVAAELAVSLSLLVGAALLARTLAMLNAVDPGFSERKVLTAFIRIPGSAFPEEDVVRAFESDVLNRVRALPGVTSAGAVISLPIDPGIGATLHFSIDGRVSESEVREQVAGYQAASPGYFETLGIPVLRGRSFTAADGPKDPQVAVVSQAFAERWFPGEDPLGKRIAWGDPSGKDFEWSTIVGVVGNTRHDGLDGDVRAEAYQPFAQAPWPFMSLVMSTSVDADTLVEPLRRVVMEARPGQPVESITTMEQVLHDSLGRRRFTMVLLWVFAGLALALAAVGLYGVMSFSVAQRSREIGIRMAVGAEPRRILAMVLVDAGRLLAIGLVAGAAGALVIGRLIRGFLFQVRPADPVAFAVAAAVLTVAALLAVCLPALRAVRTDPMKSLRTE